MISFLAILLIITILILTLMQTLLVIGYYRFHRDAEPTDIAEGHSNTDQKSSECPRVAVLLCLRGEEESTPDCIAELVGQNYPNYELHIAFDSKDDPAVRQVEELFENHRSSAHLHFFEPESECSYKCSGIVHVLDQLGDEIDIVAFCDGDAIVDINWLSDLVAPLTQDESIGATTGNRWFSPFDGAIGAQVRKLWNSAAVVQMQAYDIAWGGSMAVRRNAIEACSLKELWSKAFCEDTLLTEAFHNHGLRLHRVPNLVIENKETTTISDCFEWISRQLLTVRLHHPLWRLVLAHGITTGVATIVAPIAMLLFFVSGYVYEARSLLIAWVIYQILNFILLKVIEHCNRKVIANRLGAGSMMPRRSNGEMLSLIAVQVLHPVAAIKAMLMKDVSWRGVRYDIDDEKIRVREH